jgi:hypothetical protein
MSDDGDRLARWRLVLGGGDADGIGASLHGADGDRDRALAALYGEGADRRGGLGGSAPQVSRWLGDIRTYFPSSVVQVMQRDAMHRLGLADLLLEPEMLGSIQPDLDLVTTLLGLGRAIPERSRAAARHVVGTVVAELEAKLADQTRQAVTGAMDRTARTRRPRQGDIDWPATITANLRHYQPEQRTVVPERLVGRARRSSQVSRHVVVCIDQSGSMAPSIVYASVFGAVLASIRALSVTVIAFDTQVVDLTEQAEDPVDVLFGVQLGGGTDIDRALAYAQQQLVTPADTVVVLISDLFEGGDRVGMLRRTAQMVADGVTVVALLALSDQGKPAYDGDMASALAELGVPAFACTPDAFGDLMAAAIERRDLGRWAAEHGMVTAAPTD